MVSWWCWLTLMKHGIQRARERGFEAVVGDADRYDLAVEPYLDRAKTLVCIHSDIDRNYRVCERARTTFGIDHVVTRITDPSAMDRFDKLGVTTMNAAMDQAVLLGLLVRNPSAYELLTRTDDDKEVCEVAVHNPLFFRQASAAGGVPWRFAGSGHPATG